MPVFFYNKKKDPTNISSDRDFSDILKNNGEKKFRRIEEAFLKKYGGKIIGFFAYDPFAPLNNFDLNKNKSYLIVTDDYPFDQPRFIKKDEYIKATKESYAKFQNGDKNKADSEKYMFRSKGFFGGISEKYELPDPYGIKPDEPYNDNSPGSSAVSSTGSPDSDKKAEAAAAPAAAKEELEKQAANKAAEESKKAESYITTKNLNTQNFVGYTEPQSAALCGKHAINHVLQEEKIVKNGTTPTTNPNDPKTNPINLVDYCGILEEYQRQKTNTTVKDRMCSKGFDNIRFEGLALLLQTYLGYTIYEKFGNTDQMQTFIKINIQKRRCLGIILNLGAYHYVAISKYHTKGDYTYIDSIGSSGKATTTKYKTVDSLIDGLNDKKIVGAIAVKQNASSYVSVASRLLEQNLPTPVKGYYEITEDYVKFLSTYDGNYVGKIYIILSQFDNGVNEIALQQGGETNNRHQESFNALKFWNERVKNKDEVFKEYGLKEDDVAGFVELVNNMNEEYYIEEFEKSRKAPNVTKSSSAVTPPEPPPSATKDKTEQEILEEIKNYNGGSAIRAIFTLLPQILEGNVPEKESPTGTNMVNLDPALITQLRRTFKKAITTVITDTSLKVKGGKNTKKRKTHKKKLFRHKSRNTINRLKLVRQ
jgi:hypothetical protein